MNEDNELPMGWVETTLGEVTAPTSIIVKPDESTKLTYIGMEHVEAETMRLIGTIPASELKSTAKYFHSGDVLYGRMRPYLNKVFRPDFEGLCSSEFIVFQESSNLNSRYLQYFLNSWSFKEFASHLVEGDRPRVDWNQLKVFRFLLPPLPEQHRIVAAIEQQFTRLDAGVAALKKAQKKLKLYRSAILKAAVEGKLTEDWRVKHPTTEPAAMQLAGILQERCAKWEADQLAKMTARGVVPRDDKWKEDYKEPAKPDIEGLPELPEGWCWARAEQLCDFITKGTTPSAEKLCSGNGEIPFVKVYNLTNFGVLDFSKNPTFVSRQTHSQELARSCVFPGDVLMNIVGPPLGKVAIVPNEYLEWNINQAIAIFRPMPSYNRKFLCYSLLDDYILSWATRLAKATAGQYNLTLEICRNLPLPLPPLAEQEQIVFLVEEQLSIISVLETTVEHSLKRAERERQSILREAFAGRLVPQDPKDEPASVLLERIREERERHEREGREAKKQRGNQGNQVKKSNKPVQRVLIESN